MENREPLLQVKKENLLNLVSAVLENEDNLKTQLKQLQKIKRKNVDVESLLILDIYRLYDNILQKEERIQNISRDRLNLKFRKEKLDYILKFLIENNYISFDESKLPKYKNSQLRKIFKREEDGETKYLDKLIFDLSNYIFGDEIQSVLEERKKYHEKAMDYLQLGKRKTVEYIKQTELGKSAEAFINYLTGNFAEKDLIVKKRKKVSPVLAAPVKQISSIARFERKKVAAKRKQQKVEPKNVFEPQIIKEGKQEVGQGKAPQLAPQLPKAPLFKPPSPKFGLVVEPQAKRKIAISPKKAPFLFKPPSPKLNLIGPPNDPKKYELIDILGEGVYGANYKARNLNKKQNEDDFYAIKKFKVHRDMNAQKNWKREVQCLKDVFEICSKVNILCYKDSFIFKNKDGLDEYYIVTPLLVGYKTLYRFFKDTKNITLDEAKYIYAQIVDVKNKLNELCIHHADLHMNNIMINPLTTEVKVIDLGLCMTPQEEEQFYKNVVKDNKDETNLERLRFQLYRSVFGKEPLPGSEELRIFNENVIAPKKIISAKPGCKRINIP